MVDDRDLTKRPDDEDEDDDDSEDEDYAPGEGSCDETVPYIQRHFSPRFLGDDAVDIAEASGDDSDDDEFGDGGSRRKKQKVEEEEEKPEVKLTPEEEKAKADELWAALNVPVIKPKVELPLVVNVPKVEASSSLLDDDEPSGEIRIAASSGLTGLAALRSSSSGIQAKKATGGLSGLLASMGKKDKPSTLTKTKADWERFKNDQGIKEELHEHTKSKDSYVERQAFLQRTDLCQFEQEKSIRDRNRARQPK